MKGTIRVTCAAALALLIGGAVAVGSDGTVCAHPAGVECCSPATCKVCRPTSEVKKSTKYVYACKEEDICLPRCGGLFHRNCDDSCATAKVRTVRKLVKKPVTEEKCETKWIVDHVAPSCPAPCHGGTPGSPAHRSP